MQGALMRFVSAFVAVAVLTMGGGQGGQNTRPLGSLSSPSAITEPWTTLHCDLELGSPGTLIATFWRGYETTGIETTSLPLKDWSAWKSLKFDVTNPYREPFSVYVRISNGPDH